MDSFLTPLSRECLARQLSLLCWSHLEELVWSASAGQMLAKQPTCAVVETLEARAVLSKEDEVILSVDNITRPRQ